MQQIENREEFELAVLSKLLPHVSLEDLSGRLARIKSGDDHGMFQMSGSEYVQDWVRWAFWAWSERGSRV